MKKQLAMGLVFFCLSTIVGCYSIDRPRENPRAHQNFDLPPDYKVSESDWVDRGRHRVGWPLGHKMLRGKTLKEIHGFHPIHIMRSEIPEFDQNHIKKDDLLLSINGNPLGKDGVNQVVVTVKRAIKLGRAIELTRWRKGEIKDIVVDFKLLKKELKIPDLTKGEKHEETIDWALGPIGVNAWGFSQRMREGGSSKARQLRVTRVDAEGPAMGKLEVGDVILGANGKDFQRDARRDLAQAINRAEEGDGQGRLELKVWREGELLEVVLKLDVLGRFTPTAPFDCPKTEKIIEGAVQYLKKNKKVLIDQGGWYNYINGLGLMATGREDVMPLLKELAYESLLKEGEELSVEHHVPYTSWGWSYRTVFLCEYYLRTQDHRLLSTIREYATKIAMGQSGVGTWGHTYAARSNSGHLHGHLGGYGALNQQGLTLMLALVLAEKCGVTNKEIGDAIHRGEKFFRYFIGKGTIPYGDHGAASFWYDDNGKSGSAAVLFDLLNDKRGARFFSEMVIASAPSGREAGHCGHYWSHLWGGIGAGRAGDLGLQSFMKEMNWIFTLERQHHGGFVFQGNVGEEGPQGKLKDGTDCTGARLLQLCFPLRQLYITGRETPVESHLSHQRIKKMFEAGRHYVSQEERASLELSEILQLLRDPLPPTRYAGVKALEEREIDCVDTLMKMLDDKDPHARYGATEALGRVGFGRKDAVEKLISMMGKSRDLTFLTYAVRAMVSEDPNLGLSRVSESAIPILLKMATENHEDDPRRILQCVISQTLFSDMKGAGVQGLIPRFGLERVDRSHLVPAVRSILKNDNGAARSTMSQSVYPLLKKDELEALWPDIYRASRFMAPSGMMFVMGVRKDGLSLMSKHGIEEGLGLAAWYVRWQKGHGKGNGTDVALRAIENYGTHGRSQVPLLEDHVNHFRGVLINGVRRKGKPQLVQEINQTIKHIKRSNLAPELSTIRDRLSLEDFPPINARH